MIWHTDTSDVPAAPIATSKEPTVSATDTDDSTAVSRLIGQFNALSDVPYAEALADNIMDPDPDETAAFRSPKLVNRSLDATKYLLARVNTEFKQRPGESRGAWGKRAVANRDRVGLERRRLETIIAGMKAARGILAAPPNPRGRAYRELARRHPEEYLAIVRQEKETDRVRAAREKEERKLARKAQRGR